MLGAISGLSIVAIGAWLLYRRVMALAVGPDTHAHSHAEIERTGDGVGGRKLSGWHAVPAAGSAGSLELRSYAHP